jgi:hypothetical protein
MCLSDGAPCPPQTVKASGTYGCVAENDDSETGIGPQLDKGHGDHMLIVE